METISEIARNGTGPSRSAEYLRSLCRQGKLPGALKLAGRWIRVIDQEKTQGQDQSQGSEGAENV